MMIEAGAREISEEDMAKAILEGHKVIQEIVKLQTELQKKINPKKREISTSALSEEVEKKVRAASESKFKGVFGQKLKADQDAFLKELYQKECKRD